MKNFTITGLFCLALFCATPVTSTAQEPETQAESVLELGDLGQIPDEIEVVPPNAEPSNPLIEPAIPRNPSDPHQILPGELEILPPISGNVVDPTLPELIIPPPPSIDAEQPFEAPSRANAQPFRSEEFIPQQRLHTHPPVQAEIATPTLGVVGKPIDGWGFAVLKVLPNSEAARMKLEPGDVILAVNGKEACSAKSVAIQLLRSSMKHDGYGFVLIDNVRARNAQPTRSRASSCGQSTRTASTPLRYQKIWFRL